VKQWRPTVSVVVAAYNAADTLEECLDSLLELRYPADQLELCVIDNCSSDGTAEVLHRYRGRVTVGSERRRGPAAARNAGLRATASVLVAFTDSDCTVEPGWLESLIAPLQDPRVGVAGGAIRARPPAGEIERFGEVIHDHQRAIEVFEPPYAITMNWASRRSLLEDVGGFDERLRRVEDVDLSYRIVQAGYKLAFVPQAVVYHRNEHSLSGLLREGYAHGFHGVPVSKRHATLLAGYGHGRVNRVAYAEIGERLRRWALGADDVLSRCEAAFTIGKKAGKLAGSVRFGHLDL
jgi:GT2 family glycosyltransferase